MGADGQLLPTDRAVNPIFMDYGLHRQTRKMIRTLQDAIDDIEPVMRQ
jgi:hypothetical protein